MRRSWSRRWLTLRNQDTTSTCRLGARRGSLRPAVTLLRLLTRTRGISRPVQGVLLRVRLRVAKVLPRVSLLRTVIRQGLTSPDYHASSPPPNSQRPNQTPAPFYVAGAEIPPNAPAPLNLPVRHSVGPPGPPGAEQAGRPPAQPAPLNTSSPGQPPSQYAPYAQPNQRPTSTYGAQELATSVYDTPISPNAQNINPAAPYSPDDPYNAPPPPGPLSKPTPPEPSQPYQGFQPPQGHDGPSAPTGAPPPVPQGARPDSISPPPAAPYDARQGLPSQVGAQPQYKPYVPPSEPSAPGPADYYRQGAVNSRPY